MATIRKRGKSWQAQIRLAEHAPQSKSFATRAAAQQWARITTHQLLDDHAAPPESRHTLASILEQYRDKIVSLKISKAVETTIINRFLREDFAQTSLHNVTKITVSAYRDARLQLVKPSTFVRELGILRHCWDVATHEWGIAHEPNPFSKVRLPRIGGRRERRLRAGEFDQIAIAAKAQKNPYVFPVIVFALETALRGKEILALKWTDFDKFTATVRVRQPKNQHERVVPLTPKAMRILMDLPAIRSEQVFVITQCALKQAWQRIMRKKHIVDLHFHDLRHEAVSRFVEAGLTLPEVAQISGHRDSRSLLRYAHPSPEMIRQKFINMEGLPPVDMNTATDERKPPSLYQLILAKRQTPDQTGQNWGPDDFGTETDYLARCAEIMVQKGLNIDSPRVRQSLLLDRLTGTEPTEAIEKYCKIIFSDKKCPRTSDQQTSCAYLSHRWK
jgi:integrase